MYIRNSIHALFWGILTAGMALFIQLLAISFFLPTTESFKNFEIIENSFLVLLIYALIEESFKYFIVEKKIIDLSYGKGFVLNSWLAGLGFALFEGFIIYLKNNYAEIDLENLDLLRTGLLHILTFGVFGYILSTKEKIGLHFGVLIFNLIIHFSFNFSIIYFEGYSDYITSGIIIFLAILNLFYLANINRKLASN